MPSVIVTGAAGFLGVHLRRQLELNGYEVYGVGLSAQSDRRESHWVTLARAVDLGVEVGRLARERSVELVVHCAFVNRKPAGMTDQAYLEHAIACDLPLFHACACADARILLVSSSAVYGATQKANGLSEGDALKPVTVYGVAKATQELQAQYSAVSVGLQCSVARLFNLCGPGQREGMLIPDWMSRVSAIARGAEPRLFVRNRATARDFVDVRDAARALAVMAASFTPGDVMNVASGHAVSLMELSEELQRLCPVPYEVIETDPVPSGTDSIMHFGSADRIRSCYGWVAEIPFRQSLADAWDQYQTAL